MQATTRRYVVRYRYQPQHWVPLFEKATETIRAFTAEDALTQFRVRFPEGKVESIEPDTVPAERQGVVQDCAGVHVRQD